jgi:hypothetical protein
VCVGPRRPLVRSRSNTLFSFTTVPDGNESDLRMVYCAFAISSMLDDWSGVDVAAALKFIADCRVRKAKLPLLPPALLTQAHVCRHTRADTVKRPSAKRKASHLDPPRLQFRR